jgi:hypothetical protein
MSLNVQLLNETQEYTGSELAPHWIAHRIKHFGSAVVGFRGPCLVATNKLVDLEDRFAGTEIRAKEMLHFLGEFFEGGLEAGILWQRLFVASFAELLTEQSEGRFTVKRNGNDLFVNDRKLSVSIVTATPVSCLFHFGVNIDPEGAPVAAIGLAELKVDIDRLAQATLERWRTEWNSVRKARCKVTPR